MPLALLIPLAAASPIWDPLQSCQAVTRDKCGTDWSNSCLKCGTKSDYDCEYCCDGCSLTTKGEYSYCDCKGPGPGPTPPSPDTWDNYEVAGMPSAMVTSPPGDDFGFGPPSAASAAAPVSFDDFGFDDDDDDFASPAGSSAAAQPGA